MRVNSGIPRRVGLVIATVLCATIVACSPAQKHEGPTAPPKPSTSPETSDPLEEDGDVIAPIFIPECAGVLTDEQVTELFGPELSAWDGPDAETQQLIWAASLGPAALSAIDEALSLKKCYWGVPLSDVIESAFVAELSVETREALLSGLRDSEYTESSADGITLFTHTFDDDGWVQTNWYGFVGNVWVASFGGQGQVPVERVFENLRALNPDWAAATA